MLTIEDDVLKGLVVGGSTIVGVILKIFLDWQFEKRQNQTPTAGDLSPAEWEARLFNIIRSQSGTSTDEIKDAVDTLRHIADSLERNVDRLYDRRVQDRD